jgi:hypothetical protein
MLFPEEALAELRRARYDPKARCFMDEVATGFVWSDERLGYARKICRKKGNRADAHLMAYRRSLIRGEPVEQYRPTWEQVRQACPDWPGFRPARSSPDLAPALDRVSKWFGWFPETPTVLTLLSLVALAVGYPMVVALPFGVKLTAMTLSRNPSTLWLWVGIGMMVSGVLFWEVFCRLSAGTFGVLSQVNLPPGSYRLGPWALEIFLFQTMPPLLMQFGSVLLFGFLMEAGRLHFKAAGFAWLLYAAPALLLLIVRWKRWTIVEELFLRWGWAPIIAFNVPWLVPFLLRKGWISVFG